jgi:hypothetical protein
VFNRTFKIAVKSHFVFPRHFKQFVLAVVIHLINIFGNGIITLREHFLWTLPVVWIKDKYDVSEQFQAPNRRVCVLYSGNGQRQKEDSSVRNFLFISKQLCCI